MFLSTNIVFFEHNMIARRGSSQLFVMGRLDYLSGGLSPRGEHHMNATGNVLRRTELFCVSYWLHARN